jgi:hypothetical protein
MTLHGREQVLVVLDHMQFESAVQVAKLKYLEEQRLMQTLLVVSHSH